MSAVIGGKEQDRQIVYRALRCAYTGERRKLPRVSLSYISIAASIHQFEREILPARVGLLAPCLAVCVSGEPCLPQASI